MAAASEQARSLYLPRNYRSFQSQDLSPAARQLPSGGLLSAPRLWVVYLQLLCAMLFFGLSFVFTSLALQELRPVSIIVARLLVSLSAMVALSTVPAVARVVGGLGVPAVGDLRVFALVALFQPFLYFLSENTGLLYVSPAVAAIIIATIPVVTPIFAFLLVRERITLAVVLGALVSFAGVALIVQAAGGAEAGAGSGGIADGGASPLGVALIFSAVLAAVGYAVALRRMPAHYSSLTVVFWQNLIGLGLFLPLFLLMDLPALVFAELPSARVLGALLFLGVFPSTLSFVFLGRGIRVLGAVKANITTNTVPVFAAIFSVVVLGEQVRPVMVLGMSVVIGGVLLSQLGRGRKDR